MQETRAPREPGPFAALLREQRLAAGLTQRALAERAGLSARGIQDLERGTSRPYRATLERLVQAFALAPEDRAAFEAAATPTPRRTPGGRSRSYRRAAVLAGDAQPPRARPPARPTNLPLSLTRLFGREQQLAELREHLARARLLTLTGAGGCGKSRLALQLAADTLQDFPDGVWLVELAALAEPALVPQTAIAALGARERPGRAPADALAALLRSKAALLLLDNCEHLVEACARLAESLLSSCPDLRLLATSREPLRIPGEVVWRVPSLAAPAPDEALAPAELAHYPAVQLFLERGHAVKPGFALTPGNAASVARLCARLDGMPLAIELAAARLPALAPEQIAARLDDSVRLLVGGSRTAPTRQQTLQATLDWSYALLDAAEQSLFRRSAVFAGGWSLEAAEAVCAGDGILPADVLDLLGRLVDKSMVLADDQGGRARYRLLEPVRQYARQRLDQRGDTETVMRRHAEQFLALAEHAEPELTGSHQPGVLERLEREHANLRAALTWLQQSAARAQGSPRAEACGDPAAQLLRLSAALGWFWFLRGYYVEGRRWLEWALAASDEAPTRERALALGVAAHLCRLQGDPEAAEGLAERAVALCRARGDRAALAEMLVSLGLVAVARGHPRRALPAYRESLALCRALGDRRGAGLALGVLGEALRAAGDPAGAVAALDEALALSRSVNDIRSGANWLQFLARVAHQRGDGRGAAARFAQSLTAAREIGDRRRVANCLEGLAMLSGDAQHARQAARLLGAAAGLRDATGAIVEPADAAAHTRCAAEAQRALGGTAFAAAWDAGRALSLEQAVEEALRAARALAGAALQPHAE